jgi:homoserine dehydrogenase
MYGRPLIVLKFGGSVLTDESTLRLAVHEIYRWRRENYRVVAVVSALAGQTDKLLESCRRINGRASAAAVAAVVAGGETHSASLLALHLDRAGVPAALLTPSVIGLTAEGPPLDASPVALDVAPLVRDLDRFGVVVVPGYVAQNAEGRTCLLGRGGSDLTALFLAHRLKGRCRLIKDVDGLYDGDPAAEGPPPYRYAAATWDDALATDGSIVQHKAVRLAAAGGLEFELGRLNGCNPTRIGRGPTQFGRPEKRRRRLRTALLGRGVVGGGVQELLGQLAPFVELVRIAVRNPERHGAGGAPATLLTTDPTAAVAEGVDLVIEVLGGVEVAHQAVVAAISSGACVVTANKTLLAEHGPRLRGLAQARGCLLRCSAAVGGIMPLLERLEAQPGRGLHGLRAILNGTTNYVLDRVAGGRALADALREAQSLGLAEADPSRDLSGLDAADKLAVLADTIGAGRLPVPQVHTEPLTQDAIDAALRSRSNGEVFRHVASLDYRGGRPVGAVRLCRLDAGDPLAHVAAECNAAEIRWSDGETEFLQGKGAGRWPTAEAVIADVLEIVRRTDVKEGEGGFVFSTSAPGVTLMPCAP